MNLQIERELKEQGSFWFTFKAANAFFALFMFILIGNEHTVVGFLGLSLQVIFLFIRIPVLIEKFDERLKVITFKTQIENLYVFSRYEGQDDDTVADAFYRTVEFLRLSGNKHEVRVHLALFRDVKTFTWFYDSSGKLVKANDWREPGSSNETWEEYLEFIENFEKEDRDKRLRQLRKDNAGFDWVNENLFNQWRSEA